MKSGLAKEGISRVLTTAVPPALPTVSKNAITGVVWVGTHNMPMLMAIATPIFSLRFICSFQMTFHGSSASANSVPAEYPGLVSALYLRTLFGIHAPKTHPLLSWQRWCRCDPPSTCQGRRDSTSSRRAYIGST